MLTSAVDAETVDSPAEGALVEEAVTANNRSTEKAGKHRQRAVTILALLLCAAALVMAFVTIGGSTNKSLGKLASSSKPYPLKELLAAVTTPTPLPADASQQAQASIAALPTGPTLRSQLAANQVSVTVGGATISLGELAGKTIGYDQGAIHTAANNAVKDGLDVESALSEVSTPQFGLPQAVAITVLEQLAVQAADASGTAATTSQAQAFAQQQYDNYQNSLKTNPSLPPYGINDFLSPTVVAGYQQTLTVSQELTSIAGPYIAGQDRTPAIAAWMRSQLAGVPVTISNVPGVTAGNADSLLPHGL